MKDKRIIQIRMFIAGVAFIILLGTLVKFFNDWSPGPIYLVLLLLSFITLASGISLLSEIVKKNRKNLKILTGSLSVVILMFIIIPFNQFTSPILGWVVFICLSGSSILISMLSALAWSGIKRKSRWVFQFLLALNSGIFFFFISSMILRNYKSFEGGNIVIGYSAILSLISIYINSRAVSSLNRKMGV